MRFPCLAACFILLITLSLPAKPAPANGLDPNRIKEIAAMLPAGPTGLGKPITDRAFWTSAQVIARCGPTAKRAESLVNQSFPPWEDEAYLEFSKIGIRPHGEKMMKEREGWLAPLVLAECLENNGRYIPKINEVLKAFASDPTWTLPAHDKGLGNFHRTHYDVDLGAASFGSNFSEALYLMGDKLDPAVIKSVQDALQQRLFEPFKNGLNGGKDCYWLTVENNWNAVCLSGVVASALSTIPDVNERALYAAAGEFYSNNYLKSYSADGYDTEGMGYWGYGFEHYCLLRSVLLNSTSGKIDLFDNPRAVPMALFGVRFRIGPHAVAPFADCRFGVVPDQPLLSFANESLGLGLSMPRYDDLPPSGELIYHLEEPELVAHPSEPIKLDPLRTYFKDVGILACRPGEHSSSKLGVGIKAAGNGTHSHNDIGSYEIAVGDDEPTGDPGGPKAYNSTTFGPKRYTYKILNSFGHPVPTVNDQLQIEAAKAHPKVVSYSATDAMDSIAIDMTTAYANPELSKLIRTMNYSREGTGQVEITDQFTLSKVVPLEEALITHGTWKQMSDNAFQLTINGVSLDATIDVPGGFTLKTETISELGADPFTRLGLELKNPALATTVKMTFKPE